MRKIIVSVVIVIVSCWDLGVQTIVPGWFFNSMPGDCMGVSLPIKDNPEVRHEMALMMAMLQKWFSIASKSAHVIEYSEQSFTSMTVFEEEKSFSYVLKDTHVNDAGEEYVRLDITEGNDCRFEIAFQKGIERKGNYRFGCKATCIATIAKPSGSSRMIYRFNNDEFDNHDIDFVLCTEQGETSPFSTSLDSGHYEYQNCGQPLDMCLTASCDNSLCIALLKIIFSGTDTSNFYPMEIRNNNLYYLYY